MLRENEYKFKLKLHTSSANFVILYYRAKTIIMSSDFAIQKKRKRNASLTIYLLKYVKFHEEMVKTPRTCISVYIIKVRYKEIYAVQCFTGKSRVGKYAYVEISEIIEEMYKQVCNAM